MKKIHNSRFKKLLTNITQGCLLKGHIVDATGEITATEEVNQLLRVSHQALINAGDHLTFMGNHYAASSYSKEPLDIIYRLIPLPDQVEWKVQQVFQKDPVTGLNRPIDGVVPPVQVLWCKKKIDGFKGSVGKNKDEAISYWLVDTVSVGDLLDGQTVKRVVREQDVYKVETV